MFLKIISKKNLEPQINQFKKHPSIVIEKVNELHSEFLKSISSELEKQKKKHRDFKTKDEVLEQLTGLFENATGKEFPRDEIKKIFNEGKERYAESIPPGFKDLENKRKKGERHVYGDLIIWKELINYSKKKGKPLIFVTDDRKEDWWTIENGKTIRPREELIKEFFDLTGIRILIYNADNFLQYAKEKRLAPKLNDKTIKEVKAIRISDENFNFKVNPFLESDYLSNHSFQINPLAASDFMTNHSFEINPVTSSDYLTSQSFQINPLTPSDYLSTQAYKIKPLTLFDHKQTKGIKVKTLLSNDKVKAKEKKKTKKKGNEADK